MKEPLKSRNQLLAFGVIAVVAATFAALWFSPSQRQKRKTGALIAAARSGDTKAVEAALAAGAADVNARDGDGITVLMHAARGDRPEIANPGPTDYPDVVKLLIERGADVNSKTDTGFVAMFWAARYGHDKVAKLLIEHGADVNAKDTGGISALHWATANQQGKVIELLKAAGAKE